MKIVIVGCGKVGTAIAEQLSREGHSITVVDTDAERVRRVTEALDVLGVTGNGSSVSVLTEVGIENTDVFISVTGSDELNLIACMFAKKASGCHTIARLRNPVYNNEVDYICKQMDISTIINPEQAVAVEISRLIRYPAASKIDTFADDMVRLVKIVLDDSSPIIKIPIKNLPVQLCANILFCAVERNQEVLIPRGDFILDAGDEVTFITAKEHLAEFLRKINPKAKATKNAMIVGGGTISYYLLENLISHGIDATVIEEKLDRCEQLSDAFPTATILHGDGTDREYLLSEGLTHTGAFIPLTSIDEENVLLSLFAKRNSKAKIITKINRTELNDVVDELALDSVIYPKYMTCDSIVKTVRALQIKAGTNLKTFCRILDARVEALEFHIKDCPKIVGIPLSELKIKKNSLICCITRNTEIIIPRGADCIRENDTVIVVSLEDGIKEITDILQ